MNRKTILPVADPCITVYPIFADPLSILELHESTKGWLMCNFLQLCTNHEALNFYDFNYKLCPFLKIQRIAVSYIKDMGITIHEFLMNSIDRGYYPYMLISMRQIELYGYKGAFTHDLFINGYDEEKKIYYISDNFKGGKYSRKNCTFDELERAINDISKKYKNRLGFKGAIELLEFDEDENTGFSIERVKDSLRDYLGGTPTTEWNTIEYRNKYGGKHWMYGIDCYIFLKEELGRLQEYNELQDYHMFWEHKKHLLRLTEYLAEKGYVDSSEYKSLHVMIEEIVHDTMVIRNLLIKYKIQNKSEILEKVSGMFDSIKERESIFIQGLLQSLERYVGE